jgi:hypothetical protein
MNRLPDVSRFTLSIHFLVGSSTARGPQGLPRQENPTRAVRCRVPELRDRSFDLQIIPDSHAVAVTIRINNPFGCSRRNYLVDSCIDLD